MAKILIVFYTRYGNTAQMAEAVARGVEEAGGEAVVRRVADDVPIEVIKKNPSWMEATHKIHEKFPASEIDDLKNEMKNADGIIFGSPTRFGNMAAPMKAVWDRTSDLWQSGALIGKPGGVFTGAASTHGGQETTAVSMMWPMIHHGMIIVGVPYSVKELYEAGSPYGPAHINYDNSKPVNEKDLVVASALGKRVAEIAEKLKSG